LNGRIDWSTLGFGIPEVVRRGAPIVPTVDENARTAVPAATMIRRGFMAISFDRMTPDGRRRIYWTKVSTDTKV